MPITDQAPAVLPKSMFRRLIDLLHNKGYRVVGPTVRDGAVLGGLVNSTRPI